MTENAMRLTIHLGEDDLWHHKPLYHEIVRRARAAGLAGASVFRGVESYGAHSVIHTTRFLSMSEDLPVLITIVDAEDRLRAFVADIDELFDGVGTLVTLERVEIVRQHGAS